MQLYEIKDGKLLAYKVNADEEKLKNYKRYIVQKKCLSERIYSMEISEYATLEKVMRGESVNINSMDDESFVGENINIVKMVSPQTHHGDLKLEYLLDKYIDSRFGDDFDENQIFCGIDEVHRFFMTSTSYFEADWSFQEGKTYYHFNNVLWLPPELAAIELLKHQRLYDLATDENLLGYIPKDIYRVLYNGEYDAGMLELELMNDVKTEIDHTAKVLSKIRGNGTL